MSSVEEFRKYRIGGVAMFDLILTFVAAYIIDKIIDIKHKKLYYLSILPLAVLSHLVVGQKSFINSQLFSNEINSVKPMFLIIFLAIILEVKDITSRL